MVMLFVLIILWIITSIVVNIQKILDNIEQVRFRKSMVNHTDEFWNAYGQYYKTYVQGVNIQDTDNKEEK